MVLGKDCRGRNKNGTYLTVGFDSINRDKSYLDNIAEKKKNRVANYIGLSKSIKTKHFVYVIRS